MTTPTLTRTALTGLAAAGLLATTAPEPASAQAGCDPYSATLQQSAWPHSHVDIPVYVQLSSSGCAAAPGAVQCVAQTTLPADQASTPPLTPEQALERKCELLVDAIQQQCPRFDVINIDCDSPPSPTATSFTVVDNQCSGATAAPGEGVGVAISNEREGLATFQSGQFLTDYERDEVIHGCPEEGGSAVVFSGAGTGQSFVGGDAQTSAVLNVDGQEIAVTLDVGRNSAEAMAQQAAQQLGQAGGPLGIQCQVIGERIVRCSAPEPGFPQPALSVQSDDPGLNATRVGGASRQVDLMVQSVLDGSCPQMGTECAALGADITAPPAVPALPAWAWLSALTAMLATAGFALRHRLGLR